jgi:hypothetical protein
VIYQELNLKTATMKTSTTLKSCFIKIKKSLIINLIIFYVFSSTSIAQSYRFNVFNPDDPTFDAIKKWRSYGGRLDDQGNIVLVVGKAVCDATISRSSSTNFLAGTVTTTTVANFRGVAYTFKELTLDNNFKIINNKELQFGTTLEAISYQKDLFGKRFELEDGDFELHPSGVVTIAKGLSRAFTKGIPKFGSYYTPDFINTIVVVPAALGNRGAVTSHAILSQVRGYLSKDGYSASCSEIPAYYMINKIEVKENKGEKWLDVANVDYPGGGVIAFVTYNVVPKNGKANLFFKKFDDQLNEIVSQPLDLDYYPEMKILRVKNKAGKYDFLVLAQAGNRPGGPWWKYVPRGNPNFMEIFYLDGETLTPTYREKIELKFSRWQDFVALTDDAGATYVLARTGKNAKEYLNYANYQKDMVNFGMLKIENGKLVWKTEIDSKAEAKMMQVIKGQGVKGKVEKVLNFKTPKTDEDYKIQDNRLFLKGQVFASNLYLAVFDLNSGKLTHYFAKPESANAESDIFFTKNSNEIFWATYDYKPYCDFSKKTATLTSKKKNFPLMGDLYMTKIALDGNAAPSFQKVGDGSFAIFMRGKLIFENPNSDKIIYYGTTVTRRAKKAENVFITVDK